jgi:hypothetical protein
LTALAADTVVLPAIERAGRERGWWPPERRWVRTYGRFDPGHEPYVILVLETVQAPQALVRVEVFDRQPGARITDHWSARDDTVGWLRLSRFTSDPFLPGLAALLTDNGRPTVLRYRPSRRCTIRYDRGDDVFYAKVYASNDGERSHLEGESLWSAAMRGELGFRVARPNRWDPHTRTLWQYQVDGSPVLASLGGSDGAQLAHRIGRAAGSLPGSTIEPRETFDSSAQFARTARHGADLVALIPRVADTVSSLLEKLTFRRRTPGRPRLRAIHGAPLANHWLDDGTTLGLVNFEHFAWGDPELDAATFLGALDFEPALEVPVERLAEAFLSGYESVAGPLDRFLLGIYRGHKRLAKALRSARAVQPDGDAHAEHDLARVIECLE